MTWEEVEETKLKPSAETAVQKPKRNIKISIPKWCGKWVVSMDEYAPGIVGAKSKNLAGTAPGPRLVPLVTPESLINKLVPCTLWSLLVGTLLAPSLLVRSGPSLFGTLWSLLVGTSWSFSSSTHPEFLRQGRLRFEAA